MTSKRKYNTRSMDNNRYFSAAGKNILTFALITITGFAFSGTCSAQSNFSTSQAPANNPAYKNYTDSVNAFQQASIETKKLAGTYQLSAVQQQQLQNINLQYYTQLNQIYSGVSSTTFVPQHKIDSLTNAHNNALQAFLNGIPHNQQNNQAPSR